MTEAELIHAVSVAKLEGRALVVLRSPLGEFDHKGVRTPCVQIVKSIAEKIERDLPGTCAIVLPAGEEFRVDVYSAGEAPEERSE